jgi:hypothetical protein
LSKLEPRNPVESRKILIELPRPSYEEGTRQAGDPLNLRASPLSRLGEVSLMPSASRAAKPRGRWAEWRGFHRLSPPNRASPPHVDAWQTSFGSNRVKPWPAGQPLGPLSLGSGPTWSICQIHPRGEDDFDIWSTSPCHPLKCSNLVPKFLKSNKH